MFMKFLRVVGLRTRINRLDFEGDLYSRLVLGILFLLCLFAVCKIAPHYCCSLRVSAIMLTVLVMSLISILCTSLKLWTKTYSLVEVWTWVPSSLQMFLYLLTYCNIYFLIKALSMAYADQCSCFSLTLKFLLCIVNSETCCDGTML